MCLPAYDLCRLSFSSCVQYGQYISIHSSYVTEHFLPLIQWPQMRFVVKQHKWFRRGQVWPERHCSDGRRVLGEWSQISEVPLRNDFEKVNEKWRRKECREWKEHCHYFVRTYTCGQDVSKVFHKIKAWRRRKRDGMRRSTSSNFDFQPPTEVWWHMCDAVQIASKFSWHSLKLKLRTA